uniref:Uncharacterized protein n=2 Tax=Lepeophtheirus salmonis TaxID=72036 RepID=A0A0K2T9C1_LEPSM
MMNTREQRLRFWFVYLIGANILVSLLLIIATSADIPNIGYKIDNCWEISSKSLRCEIYKRISHLTESQEDSATSLSIGLICLCATYLILCAWALVGAAYQVHRALIPFILMSLILIPSISAAATLIVGSGGSLSEIGYISGFSFLYIITLCVGIMYYTTRETSRRPTIPYNRFAPKY